MLLRKSFKILAIFWLILFAFNANATNYYLSNSGNDANSGTDPSTPWQTLNKLNSFKNLKPGDNVLFRRGDTFYGSITVSNSGTAGNPITYGAYDAGEKPVISGFTTVSKWTNLGGNIWESTNTVSALSTCNMVVVNGVNTPMGRYPNSGYLTFQSHNGNTSITSSSLTGTPDWTGAEVVIRSSQWTLERKLITSQSSGTLSYSASILIPTNGFGLFIQNDVRTLDTENEWYYDPSTKKLRIYSSFAPSNVMVTTVNTVTSIHGSYVNIENLTIEGANNYCFYNDWAISNVSIQHCNISYSGIDGISMAGCHYLTVNSSTISNINDKAINLFYDDLNSTISNNIISNTGLIPGMGAGGQVDYIAIFSDGNNGLTATSNIITNTGYIGIYFTGNYCLVQNNFVDSFCTVIQDGGGIYTSDNSYLQRSIDGNIILNGIGNAEGTNNPSRLLAHGIYLDDNSANLQVSNNTISKNALYGIFLHNAHNLNIYGNTVYDNGSQLGTQHDAGQNSITDVNLKHNLFIAKTPSQYAAEFINYENNTMPTGTLDSNYYARPIDDSLTINIITSSSNTPITLAKWTSMHSVDVHSLKSPKVITDTSDLRFEYNRNSISHTASLPDYYMDITGVVFKTFITIAPYSSTVLFHNNTSLNIGPTADAGNNLAITLPTNTVTLNGGGTDADGQIASYVWIKISGPNEGTINNPSSASTSVSGLTEGTYVFKLTVTDDKGGIGTDSIQIRVNAAPNIGPTADAGNNLAITLPTNTVTLNGGGTDADGQIASYVWIKISGPNEGTINNPSSASTSVSGLTEGTYVFKLTVTDDKGGIGTDSIQIRVNAAPNIGPTADAGTDKKMTLPSNSIILSGTGIDVDGSISSYSWVKVSGPSAYNIASSFSAVTTISELIQGVYLFELKVIDDKGAIEKDTVQITVNVAPNMAPTVNAGADKTITLPINAINLNGNGIDSDGIITSFLWTKIEGPAEGIITDSSSLATTVKGLIPGNYIFQLTATDNQGEKGTDTLYVTVNAAKNITPTANAGGDITIVLPLNMAYLNGSGKDTDGTITAYQWRKIAGPDSVLIATANEAATVVKNLVAGTYDFELTVTDNNGETGKDTIKVVIALERMSAELNSIKVYPNPVHDIATIEITSENINSQLTLIISGFTGKVVYKKQIHSPGHKTTEKINMSSFSKGSYVISLFFNEKDKQVLTMVKQ